MFMGNNDSLMLDFRKHIDCIEYFKIEDNIFYIIFSAKDVQQL